MASKTKKSTNYLGLIITLIVIFAILISLFFIDRLSKRIAPNPPGTVGNTAGNLNNEGLFCEDDGVVYFANSYDLDTLYQMNADETEIKQLVNAQVAYINAGEKHLYYYMKDSTTSNGLGFIRRVLGIYRCNKKGGQIQSLTRNPSAVTILIDDEIFSQYYDKATGIRLCRISVDGKTNEVVSSSITNPACCYNGRIYYNDTEKSHFLYSMDTKTLASAVELRYNVWNPVFDGNYVYFMDTDNNYRLCRASLETDEIQVLTNDRVDTFNVTDQYVYYQKNSQTEPALKRVTLDGTREEIIREGNYCKINVTSHYVYFRPFENQTVTYKTPVSGDISVSEFIDAAMAAAERK